MKPTNAARLREMAEMARQEADSYSQIARIRLSESSYKAIFEERREKYSAEAAALLAGAEALEAWEWIRAAQGNTGEWMVAARGEVFKADTPFNAVMAAMEKEKEK